MSSHVSRFTFYVLRFTLQVSRVLKTAAFFSRPAADADTTRAVATPLPRDARRELVLISFLFLAFRGTAAAWFQPLYSEPSAYFFPLFHLGSVGYWPFWNYWLEYPPVLAYGLVAVRWVALAVGGTGAAAGAADTGSDDPPEAVGLLGGPGAGWGAAASVAWQRECFVRAVQIASILCELGVVWLIYALARRLRGPGAAARACYIYMVLFSTGFVALSYTDMLPILLMLAGLALAADARPMRGAAILAAGFMAKVIPIAMLPALLKGEMRWRRRLAVLAAFIVVSGACLAPFLPTRAVWLRCTLESMANRPPWETVWALLDRRYDFGYVGPGPQQQTADFFARYGVAPGVKERLDALPPEVFGQHPAQRQTAYYRVASRFAPTLAYMDAKPRTGARFWWIYGGVGAVVVAFYLAAFARMPAVVPPRRQVILGAFTLVLVLFCLKGWSPQFAAYLIPLLLIVFTPVEGGFWALGLTLTAFFEMPVWCTWVHPLAATGTSPWAAALDGPLLQAVILGRTAIFIAVLARLYPRLFRD